MAGVDFNSLPKAQQAKLQQYMTIAKDVNAAIEMATRDGKWTKADSEALGGLNGNKAFGDFDGFVSEHKTFTEELAKDPVHVYDNMNKKYVAKDYAKHPEKYEEKRQNMPSGNYIVFKKSPIDGKSTMKYYSSDGKEMKEADFLAQENYAAVRYNSKSGQFEAKAKPKEQSTFEKVVGGLIALTPLGWVGCTTPDDDGIGDVTALVSYQKNVTDFSSLVTFMSNNFAPLLQKIATNTATTANNTATTNQILNGLKDKLETDAAGIIELLKKGNSLMSDIETQLKGIGANTNVIAAKMIEVAASLTTIANLTDAINQNVINLPSNIKNSLSADLNSIKTAIEAGNSTLADLNSNMQRIGARISGQLNTLILQGHFSIKNQQKIIDLLNKLKSGQGDQTQYMLDMIELLKHIDQGVGNINNQLAESLDNDWEIINKLDQLDKNDKNTQVLLQNIYEAIQDLPANLKDMYKEDFKAVIKAINTNTATNQAEIRRLNRLLTIINSNLVTGNEDNAKLLHQIITNQGDQTTLLKQLTRQNDMIILVLQQFKTEVGTKMDGVDKWLELIYKKIPTGGTGGCKVDFDKLMAKLDEILAAIKDHDVVVTVEGGHCKCCDKNTGEDVNEGILGNLEGILG